MCRRENHPRDFPVPGGPKTSSSSIGDETPLMNGGNLGSEQPDTFVLATNRTVSVREFVRLAARAAGFQLEFSGENENEIGVDLATGKTLVRVNPKYYRPAEVDLLKGNADKAKQVLGWEAKMTLEELSAIMVEADLRRNKAGSSF